MKTTDLKNRAIQLTIVGLTFFGIQKTIAQSRVPWNPPADAVNKVNPITMTDDMMKEAKKLYKATCTPCHGDKGKGDGLAAAALKPKPADHTSDFVQKETDGSLFWKISEGRGPMPSYKTQLTETQRWALIKYIRTLHIK
jgi:mono/diheme cytochrome c family protein